MSFRSIKNEIAPLFLRSSLFFDRALSFVLFFFISLTLLAAWSGFFTIHSLMIVLVSLVASFFLTQKFPIEWKIPFIVWGLAGLLWVLLLYPVILTGGVAASADAVPTISMRLFSLHQHIPETYAPYSDIAFTYQIGFPLLASVLHSLFSWIPDYQFIWMLGSIFGALLPVLIYFFARRFLESEWAAITSAFIVFGSKLVFENFFWGEYAWLAATIYVVLGLVLLKEKNLLGFLCVAMVATLHPAILIHFILLLGMLVLFRQIPFTWALASGIVGFILSIPAIYFNYMVIFTNILGGSGVHPGNAFASNLLAVPPWIGLGLSLIFVLSMVALFTQKMRPTIPPWLLFWGFSSVVLFGLLSWMGLQLANREIELVMLAVLFSSAFALSKLTWFVRYHKAIWAVILIIGLLSFSFSGILIKSREGSKITADEIALAKTFAEIDSEVKHAIFLTPGGGKMAEIANKKPFDANSGQFVTVSEVLIVHNDAWKDFQEKTILQSSIVKNACASCILEMSDLDYAVINESYTNIVLPRTVVAQQGPIKIYRLND